MLLGPIVVAAPDSFKGSLSAQQAADAMAAGARLALGAAATIRTVPMADGGEGTLDALLSAWDGHEIAVDVQDAIGRPHHARFGLSADGRTAIIEAAEANGLPHVSDVPLQPLRADTFGVGELARAALDRGATEILLCIGGSATSDGGTGLLRALGARFLTADATEAAPGGGGLSAIDRLDLSELHPSAREARWRIAVDVDNPLVGERGAAAVFGPQKGAGSDDVARLDDGLTHLAGVLARDLDIPVTQIRDGAGMGAAGGMPAALCAVLGAETSPGWRLVAETVGLPELLSDADLVLTGEGSLDSQSLGGKVVDGVRRSAPPGTAVVVIAGRVALDPREIAEAGLTAAISIAPGAATLEELREGAAALVTNAAAAVCRIFTHDAGARHPAGDR